MLLTPAQIQLKSFESRRNFFFTWGGCVSCLRACLGARLLPQSYQHPNLSEGADRVGGQLRGDKECPFSGVTKSGRVWGRCQKAMLGVCCDPLPTSAAEDPTQAPPIQTGTPQCELRLLAYKIWHWYWSSCCYVHLKSNKNWSFLILYSPLNMSVMDKSDGRVDDTSMS